MENIILYPDRCQYRSGEPVTLLLECGASLPQDAPYRVEITRGLDTILVETGRLCGGRAAVSAGSYEEEFQGFGAAATVETPDGPCAAYTAFDVVDGPGRTFRYGFLCGFDRSDEEDAADVKSMARQHITHVQFYDWMYRHEQLLPPQEDFTDLMGRSLSLRVVKEKIALCKKCGMRPIAYGAVYAASHAFYHDHPDWALCSGTGEPYDFIGKLKIMGLSGELPWRRHIVGQYAQAVSLGFEGIHIDTYGCPKWGETHYQGIKRAEQLEREFPGVIADTRRILAQKDHGDAVLVFNNVGNWPVDTVASAPLDAIYIEVWNPYDRFGDLGEIIEDAKRCAPGKPVVLAAYIRPYLDGAVSEGQEAALLTMAAISSHGAFHLALGEDNGILTQAYYVDYTEMAPSFAEEMRRWCDFITRHGHILYDPSLRDVSKTHMGWDNYEYAFSGCEASVHGEAGRVYAVLRESPARKLVSLVNLTASDGCWNKPQKEPEALENIIVTMAVPAEPAELYAISPETDNGAPQRLSYTLEKRPEGLFISASLPRLKRWSCLVAEWKEQL